MNFLRFVSVFWCITLMFCTDSNRFSVSTLIVESATFEVVIPASGSLVAVTATPVTTPPNVREALILSWICPENTVVEQGDIVARFDSEKYEIQTQKEEAEIEKVDWSIQETKHRLDGERMQLKDETLIVEQERLVAETFSPKDTAIFSKNEIIDALLDLDYLNARESYCTWKSDQFKVKSQSELGLLSTKREAHQTKLEQATETLRNMEVAAPHAGVFVYHRNWRGESPRIGQMVWPGREIGELPDLSTLEAEVFVLESEASGLKEGLHAELELDAHPGLIIEGEVTMVSPLAKPRDRRSPVKYFEVRIKPERIDADHMRLGNRLKARIIVIRQEEVLSVPNQAVFHGGNASWVYVKHGDTFEKTEVNTGTRSLTRTVITQGLQANDEIALTKPDSEE